MSDLPPEVAAQLEQARQDAIRASREGVLLTRRLTFIAQIDLRDVPRPGQELPT